MRASGIYAAGLLGSTSIGARVARAATPPRVPDTILINANIYTVDDRMPRAQAFAIKDNRFIAVGATAEIKAMATRQTQVVDGHGMTVLPGFIVRTVTGGQTVYQG
jgi:hypothetical protein